MLSKNQIKYIRLLNVKKNRKSLGVFVAEGPKVVGDLLRQSVPSMIFCTEEWASKNAVPDCPVHIITNQELVKISFLQHPQQVLAVFPIPEHNGAFPLSELVLALDGIQDPGNLGTIIRIADWFDISTIFCSHSTVDAYNPKVVQATMGSIAHVKVIYTDLEELIDNLPDGTPVYGTLLDGENIYQKSLETHGVIVMGNEGNGISESLRQRINHRLLIPSFRDGDTAESLNVAIATAIACSEFRRKKYT